jgi:hypothetical protein
MILLLSNASFFFSFVDSFSIFLPRHPFSHRRKDVQLQLDKKVEFNHKIANKVAFVARFK